MKKEVIVIKVHICVVKNMIVIFYFFSVVNKSLVVEFMAHRHKTNTALLYSSAREVFGHIESVKFLVILNPTGYLLTSSGFAFHSFEVHSIDSSRMTSNSPEVSNSSTGYFSNSTGSSRAVLCRSQRTSQVYE